MQLTFVSNYINHHQIPFCEAMEELIGKGNFIFVQTQPMEAERQQMGWQENMPSYVRCSYESAQSERECLDLILSSEVVLFGGCEEERFITPRLSAGKLTIRYSERVYKEGQWKCITPRGLLRKYRDHTRYRKAPVYLLCSGAYVASDFHIFRAYPNKMFQWGYFPAVKSYDPEELMGRKTPVQEKKLRLLWAGRFIDWKHPELALETAKYLVDRGYDFHMDIIGGGPLEEMLLGLQKEYGLETRVSFLGYMEPSRVRSYMEEADIYLFTSNRKEGWGAVANEAMNSGCAIVADHMIGAVPYLIKQGENGFIYDDRNKQDLFRKVEVLFQNPELRREMGLRALDTMTTYWNPAYAASALLRLITQLQAGEDNPGRGTCEDLEEEKLPESRAYLIATEGHPSEEETLCRPCKTERPFSEAGIRRRIFK